MFELLKKRSRPPYDKYHDYYLKWTYQGKEYLVMVRPTFSHSHKVLLAVAKNMD